MPKTCTNASPTNTPTATPTMTSKNRRRRWPNDIPSDTIAVTGAKNGRGWCSTAVAISHARAAPTPHWTMKKIRPSSRRLRACACDRARAAAPVANRSAVLTSAVPWRRLWPVAEETCGQLDGRSAGSRHSGDMPGTQVRPRPRPVVPGFRVEQLIGEGASGSVWAAVRETDSAEVAVKVVPVGADGPEAELAAREVGVLASVDVEGLVGFHEALGLRGDPPAVAIVLDRVRGGSLQRAVTARGHLSVGESVTVLAPVARALAGLHSAGVVHGDVSPTNVLLELSGRPLLSDLGVARLAGERPGQLFGTAGFVAPEVLDGSPPTPASDVYAVGALAWWCVTGAPPGPAALRRPLAELAPGLPEPWRAATTAALRGVPEERPSAADLALAYFDSATCEALQLVVGADETSLLTARLRSAEPPGPDPEVVATRSPLSVRVPRLRVPPMPSVRSVRGRALVVLGVLAAVLAVTVLVLNPPDLPWARAAGATRPPSVASGHSAPAAVDPPGPTATAHPARGLVVDHGSAERDSQGLMQELADLRAHAMNTSSSSDLARLDVAGSPARAQDEVALDRLRESGRAYAGVELRVRRATALAVTADRASVRAVVDTTAYEVVSKSGTTQTQPARPANPWSSPCDGSTDAGRWSRSRRASAPPRCAGRARGRCRGV